MNQIDNNQESKKNKREFKQVAEQEQQTPFLIDSNNFPKEQQLDQVKHQKSLLIQTSQAGRKFLLQKQYEPAAKQFSKSIMTFEYMLKNNTKILSQQQIKNLVLKIVLPTYNNLALCYLKLKNFDMVPNLTNQVLAHDPDNIKARYRRALAYKEQKKFQQAVHDFQIVRKMDGQMNNQCQKLIKQCRILEQKERIKRKNIAKKFISGYDGQERTKTQERNQSQRQKLQKKKAEQELHKKIGEQFKNQPSFSKKILNWISQKCSKLSNIKHIWKRSA